MTTPKIPSPPARLSQGSKRLWRTILEEQELTAAQILILTCGLEAWDRKEAAREGIEREGMTFMDKWDQPKMNPLCAIERTARAAAVHNFKVLGLQMELEAE